MSIVLTKSQGNILDAYPRCGRSAKVFGVQHRHDTSLEVDILLIMLVVLVIVVGLPHPACLFCLGGIFGGNS